MWKKSFYDIKHVMYRDNLLAYTDFNKRFDIHMNYNYYQLGAVISQKGKPIEFYTHKQTEQKTWYTVMEK